ncbi:hypothetical protein EV122DRAFT_282148 [Schizophyllum commune]
MISHTSACCPRSMVHPDANLPPAGTEFERAISSDHTRTLSTRLHCSPYLSLRHFKSILKTIVWFSVSARVGLCARVITGDELGLVLWISIARLLFRPTRVLAHFLRCVVVLAFELAFTLKLILGL